MTNDKVFRQGAAEVDLELREDGNNVVWLDMLGCIHADARETNALWDGTYRHDVDMVR